jgi:hypothetical protein
MYCLSVDVMVLCAISLSVLVIKIKPIMNCLSQILFSICLLFAYESACLVYLDGVNGIMATKVQFTMDHNRWYMHAIIKYFNFQYSHHNNQPTVRVNVCGFKLPVS